MDRLLFDLRHALRGLLRAPWLTLGAATALAIGMGATTTLFSIVHGALRDLPFDQADELVLVTRTRPGSPIREGSHFDFRTWSESVRSIETLSAFDAGSMNVSDPDHATERMSGARLIPNALSLLRVSPTLGRGFSADDAAPAAPPVALIGNSLWQNRYAADPAILGRPLRIDGVVHTIVGVMPPDFAFPVNQEIWVPLSVAVSPRPESDVRLTVFGRLRDGATLDEAQAELDVIRARMAEEHPDVYAGEHMRTAPLAEMEMDATSRAMLRVMLLAVSFVLLIACVNVANLLLARASAESRGIAMRAALGASRARILTQQLMESMLIAVAGGLGGLAIAYLGVHFFELATVGTLDVFWFDFHIDGTVLAFAAGAIGVSGLLAGLLPALRSATIPPSAAISESAPTGMRIGRASRALVVTELALSCGLLIVSGILINAVVRQRAIVFPFAAERIFTAQVGLASDDAAARLGRVREMLEEVAATPAVRSAAMASVLPARGAPSSDFLLDGVPPLRAEDSLTTGVAFITPGFFDVLEAVPLLGRDISWADDGAAPRVALVNRSWVERFSPTEDPIGRTITLGDAAPALIVGVVPDLHMQDPGDPPAHGIYLPMLQQADSQLRLLAVADGPVLELSAPVRERIAETDPDLALFEVATLHDAIYADSGMLNAFATLFGTFGAGALFLTVIGLYGVVSFSVSQRTREIGIRLALGAAPSDILAMIVRGGGRQVLMGSGIGLLLALGIAAGLSGAGESLRADPLVFAGVFTILGFTALGALLVPATRAARLEPQSALRE